MKFDFSHIPTALDVFHVGLLAIICILLVLLIPLLIAGLIGLLRKPQAETEQNVIEPIVDIPALEEKKRITPTIGKQPISEPAVLKKATPDAALQLLGLLQQEARFIDFIQEDMAAHSDSEIGAAARVVHEGCHKVLQTHFDLEPIRDEEEDARVTIPKGFDSSSIRLTGNIVGEAPFTGTLVHQGWRVTNVKLPKIAEGHSVNIVASAEVEL